MRGQIPLGGGTPLAGISHEFLRANEPISLPGLWGELRQRGSRARFHKTAGCLTQEMVETLSPGHGSLPFSSPL